MSESPALPPPSPEHRRVAAGQFEHANQVIASRRNYSYGLHLLLSSCKLDPGNLIYRQALRRIQKAKYNNNMCGSWLAGLITWPVRARMKTAKQVGDHVKILELGERVLCRNPWDVGTQMDMAEACENLGLLDMAIWILEQVRQKAPQGLTVNRNLALLYEQRGNFTQAGALWELIRRANPSDVEATAKLQELAVSDTLVRGNYEESVLQEGARSPYAGAVAAPSQSPVLSEADSLRARTHTDPTNVNAWMRLAGYYRKHDQLEQAHAVLVEGLEATGNAFDLAIELADLETEPFRRNLAVTEEKLKNKPDDDGLKRLLLRLRKEINTRELEFFRRKAERFPTELGHRLEVGIRLLRAGLIDEAIGELQAVRSDSRHHAQAAYYLGLSFKNRNNWTLAQRNFEEALQNLGPHDSEMRKDLFFQLAQAAAQAGDLARAIEIGQELAYEDNSYRDIGRLVEEWQEHLPEAG